MWCGFDFDFKILPAFIRLGRARPVRGGVPSIIVDFVPSIFIFIITGLVPFPRSCVCNILYFGIPQKAPVICVIFAFVFETGKIAPEAVKCP
jgi:hypothetical protein